MIDTKKKANKTKTSPSKIPLTKEEIKEIKSRIKEINGIYNEPSTQNAIPYRDITKDGIAVIPKTYFQTDKKLKISSKTSSLDFFSLTIKFSDINYQLASDDDQNAIFALYSEILNYFEDSVWFQLTFESRKRDNENLIKKIVIPEQADDFNSIRKEYSDIIKSKLTEGDNGNELVKFMTIGIFSKSLQEARTRLNSLAAEIIMLFKKAEIQAEKINGTERLAVMYRALNPYRRNKFLFNWDYARKIGASTKDFIAPSSMYFNKKDFELGDCYGSIMSINLICTELKDRILYDFLNQSQLLCINIHVKPYDILTGQKLIKDTLMNVKAMKADKLRKQAGEGLFGGDLPEGMQESIDELQNLLKELKSKDEKLFQITLTIRSYSHSQKQMKLNCDTLRRICQSNSCILIPCDYQQEDGLCASLPLGVTKVENRRVLHTSSLAAFMPFTSREIFHIDSPRFSYYGLNTLTRNLILCDKLMLSNPNSLVLGTPGAGKSFSIKREILDVFLKTFDDIFICDPEGEYFPLVNALKGQVIKLSATSDNFLNPLDIIFDKRLTTEEDPIPDKIDFIVGLIELIVGGNGLTASERTFVDRAAKKIYERFLENAPTIESVISSNLKSRDILDTYSIEQVKKRLSPVQLSNLNEQLDKALVEYGKEKMPILEDLYNELVGYGDAAERLSTSLEMYVYGSQKFFNHRSNIDIHNRVVCFDIKNLGASLKKLGMLIIQGSVWDTVSANRKANKKTRFYIDEFHLLLKNEQTAKYCVEFWKRFRKWGGIPCGITQNVQDLLRSSFSEHIDTIFSNTEFFYLLKQATDDREILMSKLLISPQQAEYITNSDPGCGLIIFGGVILPFDDKYPQDTQTYKYLTTKPGEANIS